LLIRKTLKSPNEKEQATISSSLGLPYKWSVKIITTRDFVQKRNIKRAIEIAREGCCGNFSFSLVEINPSNLRKPQKTFNLNFTFKNL
jgi:hypothetical protein